MYFELEQLYNSLFYGDCFNILPLFPSHFVDLILADMPYNITECSWDQLSIDLKQLWIEYHRVLKENGVICLFCGGIFTAVLMLSNTEEYHYKWIWKKGRPPNFAQAEFEPMNNYEEIAVFYKHGVKITFNPIKQPRSENGKKRIQIAKDNNEQPLTKKASETACKISKNTKNPLILDLQALDENMKNPTLIIENIPVVSSTSNEKVDHPTQKPKKLDEYFINTYSNPNAIILDNFSGSFTCGLACLNTHRKFICIEKNIGNKGEKLGYIKISLDRIKKAYPSMKIEKKDHDINGYQFKQYRFLDYFSTLGKKDSKNL